MFYSQLLVLYSGIQDSKKLDFQQNEALQTKRNFLSRCNGLREWPWETGIDWVMIRWNAVKKQWGHSKLSLVSWTVQVGEERWVFRLARFCYLYNKSTASIHGWYFLSGLHLRAIIRFEVSEILQDAILCVHVGINQSGKLHNCNKCFCHPYYYYYLFLEKEHGNSANNTLAWQS